MNWYTKYIESQNNIGSESISNEERIKKLRAIYDKAATEPRNAKIELLEFASHHFKGGESMHYLKSLLLEAANKARDNFKEMRRIIENVINTLTSINHLKGTQDVIRQKDQE